MMNLLENMDFYSVLVFLGFVVFSVLIVVAISILGTREKTYEEAIAEQKQKAQEIAQQSKGEKPVKEKKKKHLRKTKEKNDTKRNNDEESDALTNAVPKPTSEKPQPKSKHAPKQEHVEEITSTSPSLSESNKVEEKIQEKPTKKDTAKAKSSLESKTKEIANGLPNETKGSKVKAEEENKAKGLKTVDEKEEKGKANRNLREDAKSKDDEKPKVVTKNKVDDNKSKQDVEKTKPVKGGKGGDDKAAPKPMTINGIAKADDDNSSKTNKAKSHGRGDEGDTVVPLTNKKGDNMEAKNRTNKIVDATKSEPALVKKEESPAKKNKKPKSELALGDGVVNGNRLVTVLKNATLTDSEVQTMIETLLNRQQEGESWVKSGQKVDPISALKKQLSETEQALANEKQLAQTTSAKLKEVRQELNRYTQADRSTREKQAAMQQEYQALQVHLQRTVDQHVAEVGALQLKFQQVQAKNEEELRVSIRRLKEENEQLKRALAQQDDTEGMAASELNRLQHELEQWRSRTDQLQAQLSTAQQGHNELAHQLQQRTQELEANKGIQAQNENMLQQRVSEMLNQLQQMEANEKTLQKELCHLQTLQAENTSLRNQVISLESASCSYKASLQEAESKLRAIEENKMKSIMEIENRQEDASKLIQSLQEEKLHRESMIDKIMEDSKQKDSLICKLQTDVADFMSQVQNLTKEVECQREKNNERIYEELQRQQKEIREVVETKFPSLASENPLELHEWLQRLGTLELEPEASRSSSEMEELKEELTQSQESETSLRSQVQHYQEVLTQTESMLNGLQAQVESEEQKWKHKLTEKEAELQQLRDDKKTLQEEKLSLENTLEEIRTAEEMQEKLRELQAKLEGEENERRLLEGKQTEAIQTASDLRKQLEETQNELERIRTEQLYLEEQKKELEIQVEKEMKLAKNASSENVKLNSLVRIGQDALKEEENIVKELQKQLAELKTTTTNGSTCPSDPIQSSPSKK